MALYSYRAIDLSSTVQIGKLAAQSESALEKALGMQGLTLIDAEKCWSFNLARLGQGRYTESDLLDLTYLLRLVVISGISLVSGLQDVISGGGKKKLIPAFRSLSSAVESGMPLSEAMAERADIFPYYYLQMIRAGEISGTLEHSLEYLMSYLEWQVEFKKSTRSLLVYPSVVLSFMGVLATILFVFVFPALLKVLSGLKTDLPLPTRIVMGISNFAQNYFLLILVLLIVGAFAYRMLVKIPPIRLGVDRIFLRLPLIGDLAKKINLSRYFKTLATLQASGLDIQASFSTAAAVVNNRELQARLARVTEAILGGGSISQALIDTRAVPGLVISMVSLGEKTGNLDSALSRASDIFDKEVRETVKRLFAAMEPMIVVLLGAMMLVVLLSIFLPIYGIVGSIRVR
ncbi:type II secretory pathway, component PulF [Desulfuromonas soudanensis]|uniref:Type II secretory pathway, component PulF n=1 Tax=Desulfuromonas soudanensis TaxID=1603606 RepID=A0A0M4CZ77_9BACT|nr:type II secretion system F family protein [Desulfuromonas soudanensis]ALC15271.1 type II secretory pathway, component PulF [Desulfuromonas soudanensis]